MTKKEREAIFIAIYKLNVIASAALGEPPEPKVTQELRDALFPPPTPPKPKKKRK